MIAQEAIDKFNAVNNDALSRSAMIQKTAEAFHYCATAPTICVEQMIAAEEADPQGGDVPQLFRDLLGCVFPNSAIEELSAKNNENRSHHLTLLKVLVALKPALEKAMRDGGLDPETGYFAQEQKKLDSLI